MSGLVILETPSKMDNSLKKKKKKKEEEERKKKKYLWEYQWEGRLKAQM